jgi:tRNA/tmRNA/rRNA uracil-C5-methylase (TrmA/RlmC/RlmD family)
VEGVFGSILPARAVYVSCNPDTLARELLDITARGHHVARVQPVDTFPHTSHIETVVVLDRQAG